MRKLGFAQWLSAQVARADAIGAFACRMEVDVNWPSSCKSYLSFQNYISSKGDDPETTQDNAIDMKAAWQEFTQYMTESWRSPDGN